MDRKFKVLIEGLHQRYEELLRMSPVTVDTAPRDTPKGGVYLFSEGSQNLYTGRTKRFIRDRLRDHVSTADDCPLAWRIAREKTGKEATYEIEGSRQELLRNPEFKAEYEKSKSRIRKMDVRYVGESDPLRQALLEIYIAVVSEAKYNDFDTH
jgi:hypothetical protein